MIVELSLPAHLRPKFDEKRGILTLHPLFYTTTGPVCDLAKITVISEETGRRLEKAMTVKASDGNVLVSKIEVVTPGFDRQPRTPRKQEKVEPLDE